MLINHLPTEILFTIFKKLKREESEESLAQCVSTCRQWKKPAQAALYSALDMESEELLDAFMDTPNELRNYVQAIEHSMDYSELSMIKIGLLFKNVVHFHCSDYCNPDLIKCMLHLLKIGAFPALQNLPTPDFELDGEEGYEACLELMKDRITEIILTAHQEESGTYYSLHKKLDSFPKLNTIKIKHIEDNTCAIWKDFEDVPVKDNIKTIYMKPSFGEEFSFDTPITPKLNVETLAINYSSALNNSFMVYVMKKFPHLKKFDMSSSNYFEMYDERDVTEKPDLVVFLKYLYSIQTVADVFLETKAEEVPKYLLSLLKLLDEKQLQDTTFKLEFQGYLFETNTVVVLGFARNDPNNRIYIMLGDQMDCQMKNLQLLNEVGSFFYRLHLKGIEKDLGKILNMVSVRCPRLNSLLISHGGDSDIDCSPSNEAIIQNHTVKRLEFRDYGITPYLLTLIYQQYPCLEDLILFGFNRWEIPGSYFSLIEPNMSIS